MRKVTDALTDFGRWKVFKQGDEDNGYTLSCYSHRIVFVAVFILAYSIYGDL